MVSARRVLQLMAVALNKGHNAAMAAEICRKRVWRFGNHQVSEGEQHRFSQDYQWIMYHYSSQLIILG